MFEEIEEQLKVTANRPKIHQSASLVIIFSLNKSAGAEWAWFTWRSRKAWIASWLLR